MFLAKWSYFEAIDFVAVILKASLAGGMVV